MKKTTKILLSLLITLSINLSGATKTWVSGTNWQTAIWLPLGVPGPTDDVVISSTNFNIDGAATCGSLTLSATNNAIINITGSLLISGTTGNLDINPADRRKKFTINVGSNTLTITGSILNPANGTAQLNVGAGGVLTVAGLLDLQTKDKLVLTGTATLNCNGGVIDGTGAITLSSTSTINVKVKYEVQSASVTWPAGATINFADNANVISSGALAINFSNVILTAGTTTLLWPINVSGNWTNNGGTLSSGANIVTLTGATKTISGTSSTTFGTLAIGSGSSYTMNNTNSCATLIFNAASANTTLNNVSGAPFTISSSVVLNQPGSNNITTNWNIGNGTVTTNGLISFNGANTTATRVAKITIANGILNANNGITFTGTTCATKVIDLTGSTGSGVINLKRALTVPAGSATLNAGTNSIFNYCDSNTAQIVNFFTCGGYNNVTLNNTSNSGATLGAAVTATNITGNVSVQTGKLTNGGFSAVGNGTKTFSVDDNATFILTGTSTMPSGFGFTNLGVLSTCNYNGTGNQTIGTFNYGNLTSSNTGSRILNSSGIIGVANVFTPGTNSYTLGTSTIDFNFSGTQNIPSFTYYNLNTSVGGTKTLAGNINVNGTLTVFASTTLDVSGSNYSITLGKDWVNNGTFNYQQGNVIFSGSTSQLVSGSTPNVFYNLSLSPLLSGINVSVVNSTEIINDLSFDAGVGTFTVTTNNNLTLKSVAGQTARVATINNPGALTINGNINVQRFAPGGNTGWTLLGAQGLSGLSFAAWDPYLAITCAGCPDGYNLGGTNFGSIQKYSETAGGVFDNAARYTEISSISDPINVARGYWVYFGNGPVTTTGITLVSSGNIVKGDVSIPLTVTGGASTDHGWNLISNPYPSPISWDLLRGANTNIDDEVQVYNPDYSAYASYSGGVGTNGLSNSGSIPMGQAFYVHATSATTLTATESVKMSSQSDLLRINPNNHVYTNTIAQAVYSLKLKTTATNKQDETALHFNSNATTAWDPEYDAHKFIGYDAAAPILSSITNGLEYSINALPVLGGTVTIPVLAKTGTSGLHTITGEALNTFPLGACVTLTDLFENVSHDLSSGPYSFTLSDTTTSARFLITITYNNSLTLTNSITQNSCSANSNGSIVSVGNSSGPWNFIWKDEAGGIVKSTLNSSVADTINGLSEGDYTVEVTTSGSCDYVKETFTIQNPPASVANFTTTSDSIIINLGTAVLNITDNSQNINNLIWDFGDGTILNGPLTSHSYSQEGYYTVLLKGYNAGCADTVLYSKDIVVAVEPLLISSVTINPTCALLNEGSIIVSGSNSGPWDYIWYDAANNVIRSSFAKTEADTLTNLNSGYYLLKMKTAGAMNYTDENYYLDPPTVPSPSFSVNADTLNIDSLTNTASFTNMSLNADSYYWNFGDNTFSTLSNPTHTYDSAGTYFVQMIAFNSNCGDSVSAYYEIEVIGGLTGLTAQYIINDVIIAQDDMQNIYIKQKSFSGLSKVSFYSILGAKMIQDIPLNNQEEIKVDLSSFKGQLILVEVSNESQSLKAVKKVIIN